jgi:hypothetical protein
MDMRHWHVIIIDDLVGWICCNLKKPLKVAIILKLFTKSSLVPYPIHPLSQFHFLFFLIRKMFKFGDGIWKLKTNDENKDDKTGACSASKGFTL